VAELDAVGTDDDRLGPRAQRADDDAAVGRMRAEVPVRVVALVGDGQTSTSARSRWMPATGIATQSGRLSSS
jgi:hypothetical protein